MGDLQSQLEHGLATRSTCSIKHFMTLKSRRGLLSISFFLSFFSHWYMNKWVYLKQIKKNTHKKQYPNNTPALSILVNGRVGAAYRCRWMVNDCRFGVSPVNYPAVSPTRRFEGYCCCFLLFAAISNGSLQIQLGTNNGCYANIGHLGVHFSGGIISRILNILTGVFKRKNGENTAKQGKFLIPKL